MSMRSPLSAGPSITATSLSADCSATQRSTAWLNTACLHACVGESSPSASVQLAGSLTCSLQFKSKKARHKQAGPTLSMAAPWLARLCLEKKGNQALWAAFHLASLQCGKAKRIGTPSAH